MSVEEALKWKDLGNKAFQAQDYPTAIAHFTQAIEHNPNDHVFYSNRSACYANSAQYVEALADAVKCVELKPDWARGYSRKGLAEFNLGKHEEAISSYKKGLEHEPENQALKEGLAQVESKATAGPFDSLFTGSNLTKLMTHPKTAAYFQQQDFVQLLGMMQQNPNMLQSVMQDKRFMDCLGVVLGMDTSFSGFPEEEFKAPAAPAQAPAAALNPAEALKEEGNKAYREKRYEDALSAYNKALEIEPNELVYMNNKAAVHFAMKDYEECLRLCTEAVAKGKETMASFNKIGRALHRKSMALDQLGKFQEATEAAKQSLLEHQDEKVKFYLKDLERRRKKEEDEQYLNSEVAEERNAAANELFKAGSFPAALTEYSEALRRNPASAKIYANRSAAYIKLMEPAQALTDITKCLELDPSYIKAYIRKGTIHMLMKEFHKALESYESGLKLDSDNLELREGMQKTMFAINSAGEHDEERVQRAMADPEIQGLLKDPEIMQVLRDLQERPQQAQGALSDPRIRSALNKLVAAGVVRMG